MKTHFHKGDVHEIYQRPLSQEEHEGKAVLVKCVRPFTHFEYPGLIVEEWLVRFEGESGEYERIVAVRG